MSAESADQEVKEYVKAIKEGKEVLSLAEFTSILKRNNQSEAADLMIRGHSGERIK